MPDLRTRYLGLELRNPIIAASSGLTSTIKGVTRCVDAGVGAVVLKSLYEEQLSSEGAELRQELFDADHPEAQAYADADISLAYGAKNLIELIEKSREVAAPKGVPIIASISCLSEKWWPEYAAQIEAAGADALELNPSMAGLFAGVAPEKLADHYLSVLKTVNEAVELPVALKLGPHGIGLGLIIDLLERGAAGVVLFHRPLRPHIDVERLKLSYDLMPSHPSEAGEVIRWIGNLAGRVNGSLCGNTGVHSVEGLIAMLLAGADAVQLASLFYLRGAGFAHKLVVGLEEWMKRQGHEKLEDFVGLLCAEKAPRPEAYERTQYMRSFLGHD